MDDFIDLLEYYPIFYNSDFITTVEPDKYNLLFLFDDIDWSILCLQIGPSQILSQNSSAKKLDSSD